ncbi:adenosine 5'-monophosphoramidase HINT3-like isoform X1 [Nelusetta ayraudi]|uniref:adenosine 5'-monophosphoramidase HINT3-like isoform X1 n=1 Tax=Nelusetta ayraudi TaxID=303726 RepID=UPI003F6EC322
MLDIESDTSEKTDECCIFCQIAAGDDEEAEIMKKSEELVCFRDVDPAAPHHFLVVPTEHIRDGLSLHRGHAGLVKRMAQMGEAVLRDQGVTDMTNVRYKVR